jgi:hypothetical protein
LAKISAERIALAFRIPLQLLGLGGVPLGSTEALMQFWIATGLGFALNHIEEAFDKLFGLEGEPTEYTEFDTSALLRSAMKDRIDALVRGVQGGVFAPNEARNMEGLDSVPYGDEPRVQAQVVPLSAAGSIPSAPGPAVPPSAPGPAVPPSAPAAKNYQAAVQLDVDALRARTKRPEASAEPHARVIRKTRENALLRRSAG